MKNIYFFFIALLLSTTSFANPKLGTINGVIVDEQQKPLDYVTVGLFKASDSSLVKTALTSPEGKYAFVNINSGSYYVKATLMGYVTFKSKIFTLNDNELNLKLEDIKLLSNTKTLNTVNITAVKPLIERKADKLVMNVENSSILSGSTALEVLQKAPGVTVDQNDKISMQGKQGVLIMIDGKQTYMSSADVANLLRNMQSSQLESIELITNPSAKYDASGNSGIINIKTKKSKSGGTNGSVNAVAGYGKNFRASAGLNLNHRTNKINIFGNFNRAEIGRQNYIGIDRISNGTTNTYFIQGGNSFRKMKNNSYKAGIDFFINKKNTIGFLFNGYNNNGYEKMDNNTLIGSSFSQVDSTIIANNLQTNKYKNMSYNLNYKSILDSAGSEISVDLDYSKYRGNDGAVFANDYRYANGLLIRPTEHTRNATPAIIDIKAFKLDYNVSLSKALKLEAGLKSSWVKTDNNLIAERFSAAGWNNDPKRSNQFVYDENVNAIYGSLNRQFKNVSIQFGLRIEQTNSKGNLITTNNVVKRSYWDFFPTLYIQQKLDKKNQLGFSYGRRVDRPSYDALNPFVYYLDQYTYNKGNPFLNPQYTHNLELSYTFMQKYLLSVSFSRTNDAITQVVLPDASQKALYQTNANLASNTSFGANLNIPIQIMKWWSMNNNLNVFSLSFKSPNLGGETLNTGKTSFQFKSQQSFIINGGFTAELSGNYESPIDYGTLSIQSRYYLDAGVNKSLLNKKANLKLSLSDVFNTSHSKITSAFPGLKYDLYQKNETQIGRISFTYRFGKNEIKPARRRATGTEAEQGRMKN